MTDHKGEDCQQNEESWFYKKLFDRMSPHPWERADKIIFVSVVIFGILNLIVAIAVLYLRT